MKKFLNTKIFLTGFVLVLFLANNINAQTIHFEFANEKITGTAPNQFYEFDILASANQSTKFKVAQLYIAYNTAGFGSNIVANKKLSLELGELLFGVFVPPSNFASYDTSTADNSNSVFVIQNNWKRTSGTTPGYTLSNELNSTPKTYVHVKIAIADPNQTAGISFVNPSISKGNLQHYYFTTPGTDNKTVYPNVTYGSGLNSPLPVELNSFTAEVNKKGILLNWTTETEVNNYGFEIEVSEIKAQDQGNEKNFTKIGFVAGNGNSNSPKKYSYLIEGVKYGRYAFRLKQVDNDGKYQYSKTVEITVPMINAEFILEQNYPNPFNPITNIRFALRESDNVRLVVYDILGNEVEELFNGKTEANKIYDIPFDASKLASGVYYYRLSTNSKSMVKKMLVVK